MSSFIINVILRNVQEEVVKIEMRRHRRNLRDAMNPFESLSSNEFIALYRLPKHLCKDLIDEMNPLMMTTARVHGIPSHIRILSALNFFATGSYQRSVGKDDNIPMSQTSISRHVTEVAEVLNMIAHRYIKFPRSEEFSERKRAFYSMFNFPGVIGLIDGTHIKIKQPRRDIEHLYYCRKGGHSKNVQIMCDANYVIIGINAKFGGTTHDAFVWRQSKIKKLLENKYISNERNFWLLGDSGYPLQPWLLTPISTPTSEAEERYNVAHKQTRSHVERCIGVLKSRFRCLSKDRVLCYTPTKAGMIINACAVLHNIMMKARIMPTEEELEEIDDVEENITSGESNYDFNTDDTLSEGRRIRAAVVQDYFTD